MTKTKPSQAQNDPTPEFPSFDPMATFNRLTQDNLQRVQAFYDELATWEARAYDRAKQTAEQMADMASESMSYLSNLAAEWRKLGLEATRKSAEALSSFRPVA